MKRTQVRIGTVVIILLLVTGLAYAQGRAPERQTKTQAAVGTGFTYQGQLIDGGGAASGSYDFEFKLYDDATTGSQVGSTVTKDDVSVSDGLFTVELDFGGAAFAGDARWLRIGVRQGDSSGAYTALSPRQPLTAAPYAVYALGAPWSGLTGVPPGFADGVDDVGSAGAHDHWGESWSGSGAGLTLNSSNEDALRLYGGDDGLQIESAGDDGVAVTWAAGHGVYVYEAGSPSAHSVSGLHNGFVVAGAESNGLHIGRADAVGVYVNGAGGNGVQVGEAGGAGLRVGETGEDGVYVSSAGDDGVYVSSAGDDGVYVSSAGDDGVHVSTAGADGVYVNSSGKSGVSVGSAGSAPPGILASGSHGFEVAGAEVFGLYVGRTGNDGVNVYDAGDDGVSVGSAANDGVAVDSAARYGVFAHTDETYGFYTPDKIYTGEGCVGCTSMLIVQNGDEEVLEPGDLVAVAGLTEPVNPDAVRPTLIVRKAEASFGQGVIGVVEGHYVYEAATRETAMEAADGEGEETSFARRVTETIRAEPAAPGEYMSVVYRGLAKVKVDAAAGPIAVGDPLSVSSTTGHAMSAQHLVIDGEAAAGTRPGTVVGKAVEPLGEGQGFIWVLVDLQ